MLCKLYAGMTVSNQPVFFIGRGENSPRKHQTDRF